MTGKSLGQLDDGTVRERPTGDDQAGDERAAGAGDGRGAGRGQVDSEGAGREQGAKRQTARQKGWGAVTRKAWGKGVSVLPKVGFGVFSRCFHTSVAITVSKFTRAGQGCRIRRGGERPMDYLTRNFWAGRYFANFDNLDRQSWVWLNEIANARLQSTTRQCAVDRFEGERAHLLPLPTEPFDTDQVLYPRVSKGLRGARGYQRLLSALAVCASAHRSPS